MTTFQEFGPKTNNLCLNVFCAVKKFIVSSRDCSKMTSGKWGERGWHFWDSMGEGLSKPSFSRDKGEGGVQNFSDLRDVINGRLLEGQ